MVYHEQRRSSRELVSLNASGNNDKVDSRYETLRSYAFDENVSVLAETWSEHQDTCADWSEMHNHWYDLYKSISPVYDPDYLLSQLLVHRYLELLRNLRWITTSVLSGAYDSAMRGLRFILEDICQATYLDKTYEELDIKSRYEKTDEQEPLRGRRLVSMLGLDKFRQDVIKGLYNELNDYVHPSRKLLMESVRDPKVVFFYDKTWYEEAHSLHQRTLDAIFYLVLWQYPKAAPVFFDKPYIESSLREMSMELTLSHNHTQR